MQSSIILLSIYSTILVINEIDCEIFSAIEELANLSENENILIYEMEKFANQVENDYVYRKLEAWKTECANVNESETSRYYTNPLNAFLMIKRATSDLQLIESRFPIESKEFLRNIEQLRPGSVDLLGAVEGLLRLQLFYKLKTKDFADGIIDGEQTRRSLSVHDLFVIGVEATKIKGQEIFALEYLELVSVQIKKGLDLDHEVDEKNLFLDLISIYKNVGNYGKGLEILEVLTAKYPETVQDRYFAQLKKLFVNKVKRLGMKQATTVTDPFSDDFVRDGIFSESKDRILTGKICRGDLAKSIQETSVLHCRYLSTNDFTKFAPFKVEETNLDPYIILFVDVVSEDEINFLKQTSKSSLGPGTITESNLQQKVSSRRIAKISWHHRNDDEIFRKLSQKVEDMTQLSQKHSEPLQTQNYGIGGHYIGHWDCFMKWDKPFETDGNRIATVLFYLSDVEKGGATVFPFLKLRILPRKGAAIFWYNLSSSGSCDFMTRHSACPVLLGNKWVSNQWIREHGNEFTRPCEQDKVYDVDRMQSHLFRTFY